jgi:hypothetical protein
MLPAPLCVSTSAAVTDTATPPPTPTQIDALRRCVTALEVHLTNERRELAKRKLLLEHLDRLAAGGDEDGSDEDGSDVDGVSRPPADTAMARQAGALQHLPMRSAHTDASAAQPQPQPSDTNQEPNDAMDVVRVLEDRGDIETAAVLCGRVVAERRATLDGLHPSTVSAVRKLASLLHDAGDCAAAAPLYAEVLEARRCTLGVRHPQALSALVDWAMVQSDLGNVEEAEEGLREALLGQLATLGKEHCETLGTVGNLADLMRADGRLSDAVAMFGDALKLAFAVLGPAHMTTLVLGAKGARLRFELAARAARHSDAGMAVAQLEQVVASMREALGSKHPQTRKYAEVLAGLPRPM